MSENIFELLGIRCQNVEHSSTRILEATHTLDVLCHIFGLVSSQDVPNQTDSIEWLLHCNLESHAVFLAVQQRALGHLFLMVAGEESESLAKGAFRVSLVF